MTEKLETLHTPTNEALNSQKPLVSLNIASFKPSRTDSLDLQIQESENHIGHITHELHALHESTHGKEPTATTVALTINYIQELEKEAATTQFLVELKALYQNYSIALNGIDVQTLTEQMDSLKKKSEEGYVPTSAHKAAIAILFRFVKVAEKASTQPDGQFLQTAFTEKVTNPVDKEGGPTEKKLDGRGLNKRREGERLLQSRVDKVVHAIHERQAQGNTQNLTKTEVLQIAHIHENNPMAYKKLHEQLRAGGITVRQDRAQRQNPEQTTISTESIATLEEPHMIEMENRVKPEKVSMPHTGHESLHGKPKRTLEEKARKILSALVENTAEGSMGLSTEQFFRAGGVWPTDPSRNELKALVEKLAIEAETPLVKSQRGKAYFYTIEAPNSKQEPSNDTEKQLPNSTPQTIPPVRQSFIEMRQSSKVLPSEDIFMPESTKEINEVLQGKKRIVRRKVQDKTILRPQETHITRQEEERLMDQAKKDKLIAQREAVIQESEKKHGTLLGRFYLKPDEQLTLPRVNKLLEQATFPGVSSNELKRSGIGTFTEEGWVLSLQEFAILHTLRSKGMSVDPFMKDALARTSQNGNGHAPEKASTVVFESSDQKIAGPQTTIEEGKGPSEQEILEILKGNTVEVMHEFVRRVFGAYRQASSLIVANQAAKDRLPNQFDIHHRKDALEIVQGVAQAPRQRRELHEKLTTAAEWLLTTTLTTEDWQEWVLGRIPANETELQLLFADQHAVDIMKETFLQVRDYIHDQSGKKK